MNGEKNSTVEGTLEAARFWIAEDIKHDEFDNFVNSVIDDSFARNNPLIRPEFSEEYLKVVEDMKSKQKALRMYFFVMYNLSDIQKGIQAGHAAVEYSRKYATKERFIDFADNHKTFILLSGGGSEDMLKRREELNQFDIPFSQFREPDLNNSLSALAFILPEDVFSFPIDKIGFLGNDPYWFDSGKKLSIVEKQQYEIFNWIKRFRLA